MLFPMGQQFEVTRAQRMSKKKLREYLGLAPGSEEKEKEEVLVVEMVAVDEFWSLATDFFRDGGSLSEAKQVIQNRLRADEQTFGADHLEVA